MTRPAVPYPAVALLLLASTALRLPYTFRYPSFWAEDATVLFRQGVETGAAALLLPLYGSYHALPRLIVLISSLLPVAWAPALYALGAGLVSSACLALFARPGFRWLVPDDRVRLLMCWLFSLAPGTNEGFFALCTLNYAVFCGLLFLLLERDEHGRWRMGLGRALLVSFLWLSAGQGVVLALPLAVLFWQTRNRAYLLCLATLGLSAALNLTAENSYRPTEIAGPRALVLVYLDNLGLRLAFVPLVGQRWIRRVYAMSDLVFYALSAALLGGYLYAVGRKRDPDAEGKRVLLATVLATMATFPLTVLVRDYALAILRRQHFHMGGRISLVPSTLALLLLWLWLARPAASLVKRAAACAFLAWTTLNVLYEPFLDPVEPFRPVEWPQQAAIIEKALEDRRAGRLREPVVVKDIRCRPRSPDWKIDALVIRP
jgi:hypothetical protein